MNAGRTSPESLLARSSNALSGSLQPDVSWIKKHVSVLDVGKALDLRIQQRRARCWRTENHRNGDADPSLRFYERGNRVRCFVCDMLGGHSCIDLVMGVLGIAFRDAVNWIAERFPVPNAKAGRPHGSRAEELRPYRVGVSGNELEVLVRSGMFGRLSPAEGRILITLTIFKDNETGNTRISYQGIMRYAGVGSRRCTSRVLKQLQRLHAIQINRGSWVGEVRECSSYRVTLEDPKFLELCNEVSKITCRQVEAERAYRQGLRFSRDTERRTKRDSLQKDKNTCEGLDLCSPRELNSNKPVPSGHREIRVVEISSLSDELWMIREREMIGRQDIERVN